MNNFHHIKVYKETGEIVEFFVQGYPPPILDENSDFEIYPLRPEDMVDDHIISGQVFNQETFKVEDTQISLNTKYENFLNQTDWIVSRHREQVELGEKTSLTSEEYTGLIQERQRIRNLIL